ncbi:MAG: hypothetical protein ACYDBV_14165, partial [Nitrospiria bacterium]
IDRLCAYDRRYGYNKAMSTENTTRGMHLTEEHKKKCSEALKGRKQSAEHVRNAKLAHVGLKKSELTKKRISIALAGRKHTEDEKRKITEGMLKSGRVYKRGYSIDEEHRNKIKKTMKLLATKRLLWKQNLQNKY